MQRENPLRIERAFYPFKRSDDTHKLPDGNFARPHLAVFSFRCQASDGSNKNIAAAFDSPRTPSSWRALRGQIKKAIFCKMTFLKYFYKCFSGNFNFIFHKVYIARALPAGQEVSEGVKKLKFA